jgi:hypothetical protein
MMCTVYRQDTLLLFKLIYFYNISHSYCIIIWFTTLLNQFLFYSLLPCTGTASIKNTTVYRILRYSSTTLPDFIKEVHIKHLTE